MKRHIKSYLISDPNLYPKEQKEFCSFYSKILDTYQIDFACYRDKSGQYNLKLLETFLKLNAKYKIPSLINSDYDLAFRLGFDGLHCNSLQIDLIPQAKAKNLLVFFSAHNENELKEAFKKGADAITFSPIFHSPNKGEPLGVEELERIVKNNPHINIIALGGIVSKEQIQKISHIPLFAYASIRYFVS
ncbi:thiamine phosphate synthase [Helicobacter valdiviensis]|uniref:Thiamine phosphate synthase n=1 Tax=Helicobacter valdiviensis TaxID=1458358 RepID=A0A2W6PMR0_9HELI|nr:thiamine phosphate synthase [Helicobacter valdiviensis]PZT47983.1 thiamine phosphate synthase [Helicobacter valdiviensis]